MIVNHHVDNIKLMLIHYLMVSCQVFCFEVTVFLLLKHKCFPMFWKIFLKKSPTDLYFSKNDVGIRARQHKKYSSSVDRIKKLLRSTFWNEKKIFFSVNKEENQ